MRKLIIILILLTPVVGRADVKVMGDGEQLIWSNNSQTFSIAASGSMSESVDYIWPVADGSANQVIITDGSGVLAFTTLDISASTNLTVTSPITLTGDNIGWGSTLIDATTWSDGTNASNIWTFNVSGTDHTMTAGNGLMTFNKDVTVTGTLTADTITDGIATIADGNIETSGTVAAGTAVQTPQLCLTVVPESIFLEIGYLGTYTVSRSLNIDLGDDSVDLTFSDDTVTLGNWFDQDVMTTAGPTFANITDSGLTITRVPYASTAGLLIDSANMTFDGTTLTAGGFATANLGTFGEVNIGSTGNTNTILAVGTADIAPTFKGLVEIQSSEANPIANTESSALTIHSVFDGNLQQSSTFGFGAAIFLNPEMSAAAKLLYSNTWVGIYGAASGDLRQDAAAAAKKDATLVGLWYTAQNTADWTADVGVGISTITTKGLKIIGNLGYPAKTISGDSQGVNFGAEITADMLGTYNATNAGLNFGICIDVDNSITDATGNITSYALYIDAEAGSTEVSGGVITSWGLYEANGRDNAFAGNLSVGSVVAPTVALDVAGAGTFTGTVTANILKATGNGLIWSNGTTGTTPASGAGTRLMWIPAKIAFRAGAVTGAQWDAGNIGGYSFAAGYDANASGNYSVAMGNATTASGNTSVAMGESTTATGEYSVAMGNNTIAGTGNYSVAMGHDTTASGVYSVAMGNNTTANNSGGVAMGNNTIVSGVSSVAMGANTTAAGSYTVALGRYMQLTVDATHTFAFGYDTSAVSIVQPDTFFLYGNTFQMCNSTTGAAATDGFIIEHDVNDVNIINQDGNLAILAGGGDISFGDANLLTTGTLGIGSAPTAALSMGDDKLIAVDVDAGLTASTTQSQGQGALTAQVNQISTVANKDDTVTLISAVTGVEQTIINDGNNTLLIFPASGDNLGLGPNTPEELEANERVTFVAYDTTNWAKESSTEIIHAEIHDEDNTDAFVINDAGGDFHSYHTNGLVAGDLADWTFDAGGAGTSFPIASIADGADSGVDIEVTTTGNHLLAVGDIISQTNLTDPCYVGVFDVKAIISATQYEVAAIFTADGTGTMEQAATLEADAVAAGVYDFTYCISAVPVGNNETFDFQLYKEATTITGSKIRRKFGASGDFGSMAGCGVIAVAEGDKISFALSNEDSAANIIIRNLTIVLIRL